jgi:hypothetical protein
VCVCMCVSLRVCTRVRGSVYVCAWVRMFEGLLRKMCEAGVGWEGVGRGRGEWDPTTIVAYLPLQGTSVFALHLFVLSTGRL